MLNDLSKELQCGFWDWYSISGGANSLKMWLNEGLSRQDLIHLTNSGYKVKGKLLYDAIQNSIDLFQESKLPSQIVLDYSKYKMFNSTDFFASNPEVNSSEPVLSDVDKNINIGDYKQNETELTKQTESSSEGIGKWIKSINKEVIKDNSMSLLETITVVEINNNLKEDFKVDKEVIVLNKEVVTPSKEIITEKKVVKDNKTAFKKIVTEKGLVEVIDTIIPEKLETKNEINQVVEKEKLAEEINAKSKVEQQNNTTVLYAKQLVVKKKVPFKPKSIVYKVKNGDCLGVIADRHNVTITQLKRWNNRLSENLQIGQSIIIQK